MLERQAFHWKLAQRLCAQRAGHVLAGSPRPCPDCVQTISWLVPSLDEHEQSLYAALADRSRVIGNCYRTCAAALARGNRLWAQLDAINELAAQRTTESLSVTQLLSGLKPHVTVEELKEVQRAHPAELRGEDQPTAADGE
jgi:hypothetical protein